MKTSDKFAINVGRQLGSGGRFIGERLAREFGIKFYDKELLDLAAVESGFDKKLFESNDEKRGWFRCIFGALPVFTANDFRYDDQLSSESLFKFQSDAIRKAAERESCVFVGRCADYVLRDNPRCVNIFICANLSDRVHRISELAHLSEAEAEKCIQDGDKRRASYYNYYSAGQWGDAATYHLCINSSLLGLEQTADFIKDFVKARLML